MSAMASRSLGNLSFPTQHVSSKTQFVFGSKPQFVSFSGALRKPVRQKFSTRVMGSSASSSQKPDSIQGLLSLTFPLFFVNRIVNFILYDSYTLIGDPLFDFCVFMLPWIPSFTMFSVVRIIGSIYVLLFLWKN